MRVYECGRWKWIDEALPTKLNIWDHYKEETCIRAENEFSYCDKKYYQEDGFRIISPPQFYDEQEITQEDIYDINRWFEARK